MKYTNEIPLLSYLGYGALLILWLWVFALFTPEIISLPLPEILNIETVEKAPQPMTFDIPETAEVFILGAAIVISLGAALYALVKAPRIITNSSRQVTKNVSGVLVSRYSQHAKSSDKNQRLRLSAIVEYYFLMASTVAALPVALIANPSQSLPQGVTLVITLYLMLWPTLWFTIDYLKK